MHDWPETSESLIQQIQAGPAEEAAWSAFLAIYRPVVYRLARTRGLQHADAEDISQQVFASVSRAVEHWKQKQDHYRSADEFAELLETCLAHIQLPTDISLSRKLLQHLNSLPNRIRPKNRGRIAAGLIATILFAGGLCVGNEAPDIAGNWRGDDWGKVTIEPVARKTNQDRGNLASVRSVS